MAEDPREPCCVVESADPMIVKLTVVTQASRVAD